MPGFVIVFLNRRQLMGNAVSFRFQIGKSPARNTIESLPSNGTGAEPVVKIYPELQRTAAEVQIKSCTIT